MALFEDYAIEQIESKYGKGKAKEFIKRESFGIMIPDDTKASELDLVSEKIAELFVTEWLNSSLI